MSFTDAEPRQAADDDGAPDRVIEQDPHEPGRHNARFIDHGHHVWAIIRYLKSTDGDIVRTAKAWNMSVDTVQAAIRYYERHRDLFDALFLLQDEEEANW